ncbi:MAG: S41 family peptidase [Gemmataceae bacterium]
MSFRRAYPEAQERYWHCLRRYFQTHRHKDNSYKKKVLSIRYGEALQYYEALIHHLSEHALDRERATPSKLYQWGLKECEYALMDPTFLRTHLPNASSEQLRSFRRRLTTVWAMKNVTTIREATKALRGISRYYMRTFHVSATPLVLECLCGSCYAVDDYTMYLTPADLRNLVDSLKGETVGIGVKLGLRGDQIVITRVAGEGPAFEDAAIPFLIGEEIVKIDGRPTQDMALETAVELLQGAPGSKVMIEIHNPSDIESRVETLTRRRVRWPSVLVHFSENDADIGIITIQSFQANTAREVQKALADFQKHDVKAIVVDLRGNRGGLFNPAIQAAELFLQSGTIVSTKAYDPKLNRTFTADNPKACTLPLVVLVDGMTASSAEVMAGALKGNERPSPTILVGQTTYGKSCVQQLWPLRSRHGGKPLEGMLRVTIAKFYSPSGVPYSGTGIVPHKKVDNVGSMDGRDHQLDTAIVEIRKHVPSTMVEMVMR